MDKNTLFFNMFAEDLSEADRNKICAIMSALISVRKEEAAGLNRNPMRKLSPRLEEIIKVANEINEVDYVESGNAHILKLLQRLHAAYVKAKQSRMNKRQVSDCLLEAISLADLEVSSEMITWAHLDDITFDFTEGNTQKVEPKEQADYALISLFGVMGEGPIEITQRTLRTIAELEKTKAAK